MAPRTVVLLYRSPYAPPHPASAAKRSADRGEIRGVSPQFAGSRCERLTLIVLANSFKVSLLPEFGLTYLLSCRGQLLQGKYSNQPQPQKPVVVAGSLLQGTGHEFLFLVCLADCLLPLLQGPACGTAERRGELDAALGHHARYLLFVYCLFVYI